MNNLNILIIDRKDDFVKLIRNHSKKMEKININIDRASSPDMLGKIIPEKQYDLIISNIPLPDIQLKHALNRLQRKGITTPVIIADGSYPHIQVINDIRVEYLKKEEIINRLLSIFEETLKRKESFTHYGTKQMNLLETAFENMAIGVAIIDKNKKIVLSNPQFKSFFPNITFITKNKRLDNLFRLSIKELEFNNRYVTSMKSEKGTLRVVIYRMKTGYYSLAVTDMSQAERQEAIFHTLIGLYEYFFYEGSNIPEMMERIIDALSKFSSFERGIIRLFNENKKTKYLSSFGIEKVQSTDIPEEMLNYFFQDRFRYGDFYYIPYSERKRDEFINNGFLTPSKKREKDFDGKWHPQDTFIAPLRRENKLFGILSFDDPVAGRLPTKEELQPLRIFVHIITEFVDEMERIKKTKKHKDLVEGIFENLNEGIVIIDEDQNIIFSNTLGKEIWENPKLISLREEKIREEFIVEIEGKSRNIFAYSKRINSYLMYVFIDITDKKRKDKLYQNTQRLAQLGELSAGIAHEINNPLQSIVGYAQLLKEVVSETKREELIEYSNLILSSALRAKKVVDFLASFGVQMSTQERIEYYISKPIKEAYGIINDFGDLGNIRLSYYIDNDFMVEGSPSQMTEAIINLLKNSIESMERGHKGDKINIYADTKKDKGIIEIEDNGAGIEDSEIGKVFDTFYTTKKGGAGLGLGIVRRIVTLHRGKIELVKHTGGVLFRVTLPILKEKDG